MILGYISQMNLSVWPTLWFMLIRSVSYIQILPLQFNYSCWDISMQCCCVVHCTLAPYCDPESQQFSPRCHVCAGRLSTQFINITWRTMEPLAAHPSDSKGGRLSCQSHIQEGGMCGEYGRCCLFFGGSEMWKGLYRNLYWCVRLWALLTGTFPGSAWTIGTEEDVLMKSMGIFETFAWR